MRTLGGVNQCLMLLCAFGGGTCRDGGGATEAVTGMGTSVDGCTGVHWDALWFVLV